MSTTGRQKLAQETKSFDDDVRNRASQHVASGCSPWQAHNKALHEISEERMRKSVDKGLSESQSSQLESFLKGLNTLRYKGTE